MFLTIDLTREILSSFLKSSGREQNLIKITPGCGKSDGYVSYIYRITLETHERALATNGCPQEAIDLIMKYAPVQEQFRELIPVRKLYLNEIHFYTQVYVEFQKLQEKHRDIFFANVPKCIASRSAPLQEIVVLEDVRPHGYEMIDKRLFMDEAHLELVFHELGKFHALSFGLHGNDIQKFGELTDTIKNIQGGRNCMLTNEFCAWFYPSLRQTQKLFSSLDGDAIHNGVLEKLEYLDTNLHEVFEEMFEYTGNHPVISHMDCWSNNILFKYKHNKPVSIYLLDFQYVYVTSPVIDVAFLFYVSAKTSQYCRMDTYLRIYYDSLCLHAGKLDVNIKTVYPWRTFKEEWMKFSKYGYLRGILGIPLSLRDYDDVIDVKDVVDKGIDTDKAFGVEDWSPKCEEWIKMLTLHMAENGFI